MSAQILSLVIWPKRNDSLQLFLVFRATIIFENKTVYVGYPFHKPTSEIHNLYFNEKVKSQFPPVIITAYCNFSKEIRYSASTTPFPHFVVLPAI